VASVKACRRKPGGGGTIAFTRLSPHMRRMEESKAAQGEALDEEALGRLVERFYAKVRLEAELGPIFNGAIDDWPHHLEKLKAFWSSVMLTTGRYKGQPMAAHMKHEAAMKPELFQRWLGLWRETAAEVLSPEGAAAVAEKADRIAESLQLGLSFARGEHPMAMRTGRRDPAARGGSSG
jgi:hemoglobin